MDSPFIYDKFVTGKNFIGRKTDCTILSNLLMQKENVVIYAPPKSGKSSLIQQTFFNMRTSSRDFVSGKVSLLNLRSLPSFLCALGSAMVRMVATTPAEYASVVGKHLQGGHFVFDPEALSERDEVVSLNWDPDMEDVRLLLSLPYRLAAEAGRKLIFVVEEFQDVALLDEGDGVLRVWEQVVKEHSTGPRPDFSWIFTGSMVNAMKDIFRVRRMFYRTVEPLTLSPVDEREAADHMVRGFLSGGKVIDRGLLAGACRLFKGNLWYMNHFVAICDSRSKGYIMEPVLMEALESLLSIHEPRFRAVMHSLTTHQVNLLRAVVDGHDKFSGSEVVRAYGLNSSANVKRVKDALIKKEILTFDENDKPLFLDPLFEWWVTKYYFNKGE